MLKRFMNSLTFFSVLWSVFFIIVGTYELIAILDDPNKDSMPNDFFELLIYTISVYFLIGILNYIFFNKITLWHKKPKI